MNLPPMDTNSCMWQGLNGNCGPDCEILKRGECSEEKNMKQLLSNEDVRRQISAQPAGTLLSFALIDLMEARTVIELLLDRIDYTDAPHRKNMPIGQALQPEVLERAREALGRKA